jgi:hypothetical protein
MDFIVTDDAEGGALATGLTETEEFLFFVFVLAGDAVAKATDEVEGEEVLWESLDGLGVDEGDWGHF